MVYIQQLSKDFLIKVGVCSGDCPHFREIALIIVIFVSLFLSSKPNEVKYCNGGFHGSDNVFKNMQVSLVCPI